MAVRFCFVRVLFALNIYVHGGVGSATRILCGIDTERTGGGGGGEQGCGWRLYSWIDRLFSCMKCQRWVKSARHDFPRPSSAQLRARSQTFIIKRGRRASNVHGEIAANNKKLDIWGSRIVTKWVLRVRLLSSGWHLVEIISSIVQSVPIIRFTITDDRFLHIFSQFPESNVGASTRLVWSKKHCVPNN